MNPFLRKPSAFGKTPLRAEQPEPKTAEGGVVTLRMYDPIDSWGGTWGLSAKEFVSTLDALPDDTSEIRLLISSPGGEVWEALAILNALRQHPAKVVAVVEGVAASSASFIAAAADETLIMRNAEIFVHSAWGLTVGNSAEMVKMAADLTHEDRNISSIYAAKAGGTIDEWLAVMAAETWYSAEEAVSVGLADRVIDGGRGDAAAQARNRFDLSMFAHAGRAAAPGPLIPSAARAEVTAAAGSTTGEEPDTMSDTLITGLRERLGIAADADEATALSALDEALAEQGEPAPVAQIPAGHVTIPAAQLADLQAGAAAGTAAQARLNAEERDRFLDAHRTKYLAANRQAWAAEYDRNPETTRAHFAQAADLLPQTEIGHVGPAEDTAADAEYYALFPDEKKVG